MNRPNYLTINEVCQLYQTTPRTLRYYESEGLITCTRNSGSSARLYSPLEQEKIKQVLRLRSIHLSIHEIKDLMSWKSDLNHSIEKELKTLYLKREDLFKQITTLEKASNLLLDHKYIDITKIENCVQDDTDSALKSFIRTSTLQLVNQEFDLLFANIDPLFFKLIHQDFFLRLCDQVLVDLVINIIIESINMIHKDEAHATITGSLRSYLISYDVTDGPVYRITGILFTPL